MYYLNERGIKSALEQGHATIDPVFFTEEYQNSLIDAVGCLEYEDFKGVPIVELTVSERISLTGKKNSIILILSSDYTLVTTGEEDGIND